MRAASCRGDAQSGGSRSIGEAKSGVSQPGLFSLLPQVVDAINLPVMAAGGIADARWIVAVFALGVSAAQIGTAYLLTPQATISELHCWALRGGRAMTLRVGPISMLGVPREVLSPGSRGSWGR